MSILHVKIIDIDDNVVADIDGTSTADCLAYFLRSRGIVSDATEDSIQLACGGADDETTIGFLQRNPITSVLEGCWVAEVH